MDQQRTVELKPTIFLQICCHTTLQKVSGQLYSFAFVLANEDKYLVQYQ